MGKDKDHFKKHGYTKVKTVGKGGFGKAIIAISKENGKNVIIKKVASGEEAKKEVSILQVMSHLNIVHYIESFQESENLYIVMEYCERGDLSDRIKNQKEKNIAFTEDQITEWFVQICQALEHVHDKKVMHRDIKPQNIFLANNGQIKLGDFGISKICQSGVTSTEIGTKVYMCPEILNNHPYTNSCDIWSLGCVLYELCMLQHSFGKTSISNQYSSELQDLVKQLLMKNPADRPSIKEVLQKPCIQQHRQRPTSFNQNVEMEESIGVTDSDCISAVRSEEDAIAAFENSVLILSTYSEKYFDVLQKIIKYLYALADEFESKHKNSTIGSLSGSVMGAVGGIMSIVGLALTPFTLGASLIVTGVGIGVAVAGGTVGATSNVVGMVKSSNFQKIFLKKCNQFTRRIEPIIISLHEIKISSTYLNEHIDCSPTGVSTTSKVLNGLRVGKVFGAAAEAARLGQVLSMGRVAAQAAKAVRVTSAVTGVLSALFLIMDVAFIVIDSREIHKMNTLKQNSNTNANPGNLGTGSSRADLLEEVEKEKSNTFKLIKEIRKTAGEFQTALDEVTRAKTEIEKEQRTISFQETSLSSLLSPVENIPLVTF